MPAIVRIAVVALAAVILTYTGSLPAQSDPARALWRAVKRALEAPDGEAYFELNVKGAQLLPLKGTLISALINDGVSKLTLGMTDPNTADVTLVVHTGERKIKSKPTPGASIEFEGIAIEFTKTPFMLTFDLNTIDGLDLENPKKPSEK
jgi:hypothetical protein